MDEPTPVLMPTWIGAWAVRVACVILGLFVGLLALDFFGLGKLDSPFHSWSDFAHAVGIVAGIALLLLLEAYVERKGWIVAEPKQRSDVKPPGTD